MNSVNDSNGLFKRIVKEIIRTQALARTRNDHLVPQSFNCSNIDLILDSIARLINDEKTNIVSSVQLFTKCNSNKIEYISISGNKVDNDFIILAKNLVINAINFKKNRQRLEQINYVFESHSIATLKELTHSSCFIITNIRRSTENSDSENFTKYEQYFKEFILENQIVVKKLLNHRITNEIKKASMVYLLVNFTGFIFDYYYRSNEYKNDCIYVYSFYISDLSVHLLKFLQAIWDSYSFNALSNKYFDIEKIQYIKVNHSKFETNNPQNIINYAETGNNLVSIVCFS